MFHLYGLVLGVAIVVGWVIAERKEPRAGELALPLIIGGIIGARIYHVVEYFNYYSRDLSQVIRIWEGGVSIWGAIGGGLLVWATLGKREERVLSAIVTALPFSQAVGRLANAVNGEFMMSVWGIQWWAAELVMDLGLGLVMLRAGERKRVGVYLVGYSIIRLLLSWFRHDTIIPMILGIVIGSYLLWRDAHELPVT